MDKFPIIGIMEANSWKESILSNKGSFWTKRMEVETAEDRGDASFNLYIVQQGMDLSITVCVIICPKKCLLYERCALYLNKFAIFIITLMIL